MPWTVPDDELRSFVRHTSAVVLGTAAAAVGCCGSGSDGGCGCRSIAEAVLGDEQQDRSKYQTEQERPKHKPRELIETKNDPL